MENNTVALTTPIEQPADRVTYERSIAPIPAAPPGASLATLTMNEMVESVDLIKNAMKRVMVEGVDYGKIPGTDKPTLLKPGAEKLCVLFRLATQYDVTIQEFEGGHREYRVITTLIHINTGQIIGQGVGSCSTLENKYRYRNASRKCPQCGKEAIIKGKAEYGGGWLCFKKKDGCGAKFSENDPAIIGQDAGKVENPDIADVYNTVFKIAKKRSQIDATLTATAASAIFTQDVEDLGATGGGHVPDQHSSNGSGQQQPRSNGQSTTQQRPAQQRPAQQQPPTPTHRHEEHAAPFQRGYVVKTSRARMTELMNHFGFVVERKERDYNGKTYTEYHVAGTTEPIRDTIPEYILQKHARGKDDPQDRNKGNWIGQGRIAFGLQSLDAFFLSLDEHERTVKDRKPPKDPPLLRRDPQMLPQYADDSLPF